MKNCPKCGGEIKENAKFCRHCGEKIEQKPEFVFCDECGAKLEAGSTFCDECGAKLDGAPADDPWGEFEKPKNDDPWASFADYKEPETIVVEKIVEVEKPVVVEKPVEVVVEKVVQQKPSQPVVSDSMERDYQEGLKIIKKCSAAKKVLPAIDLMMPKANTGDKQAMLAVARAYKKMSKYDKAFEWFEKTGDASVKPEAEECIYQHSLYLIRSGVSLKNKEMLSEGIELIKTFAERGNLEAQHMLAFGYDRAGDNTNAYNWYKRSADAGYSDSQYSLGECYKNGWIGLPVDRKKAYQWYKTAADNGNPYAKIELQYWKD